MTTLNRAAAEVAVALNAAKLILLTDVPGVLGVDGRIVAVLSKDDARQRIDSGEVTGGMIPKLEACLRALDGIPLAHIVEFVERGDQLAVCTALIHTRTLTFGPPSPGRPATEG